MTAGVSLPDLAAATLRLVDVLSVSRSEAALVALVRELVAREPLYDDGEAILYGDARAPVLLPVHPAPGPASTPP